MLSSRSETGIPMPQPTQMPQPLHPELPQSTGDRENGRADSMNGPTLKGDRHCGQRDRDDQQNKVRGVHRIPFSRSFRYFISLST